ncbi:hypothetical protein [Aurantiacibacter poecillastricola]|uniref:hypothetical protein n=1 Tax=Aurantiacibacter poecillastricola TaxID=3064385 RepID=UPI00273FF724|nr:hypothetical protein [Aurantiacibacter sp. 219JJ12-13]MDP5262940.1 hypothetical protein [Aurantiacibacter sp. 219JJ12-13]
MGIRQRPATPWHFWVVGILALLFYGGGSYYYLMMQSNNEAYLASYTARQLAYFDNAPTWFDAAWAIGVWVPLLGALLFLIRNRFAFYALLLGLVGFAVASFYQFSGTAPSSMTTGAGLASTAIIGALQLIFVLYAGAMLRRSVLR